MKPIEVEIEFDESKLLEEVDVYVREIAERIVEAALRNLILGEKYVFGWLYHSRRIEMIEMGHYEIIFDCDYAAVVEFGRSPNSRFPPPDAILMWLIAKFDMSVDEAKRLVYAVCRKIAKEGIEPYPFLRMAVNEVAGEEIFTCEESWEDFEKEEEEEEE